MTEQSMPPHDPLSLFRPAAESGEPADPAGLGGGVEHTRPRWKLIAAAAALSLSAIWLVVVVAGLFLGLPGRTDASAPQTPAPAFPALQAHSPTATSTDDPTPTGTASSRAGATTTSAPPAASSPAATISRPATTRRTSRAATRRPVTSTRPRTTGGTRPPTLVTPPPWTPPPALDPRFRNCQAAIAQGYGPYYLGRDPEYAWYPDRDGNGVVCDRRRGRGDGEPGGNPDGQGGNPDGHGGSAVG